MKFAWLFSKKTSNPPTPDQVLATDIKIAVDELKRAVAAAKNIDLFVHIYENSEFDRGKYWHPDQKIDISVYRSNITRYETN